MDPQKLERELSLDLDGRLPATRRTRLLAHLARDPEAQALADQMRQTHELARDLKGEPVGPQFRDSLMRRIRSGEGSPESVFRSPVPLAAKARYLGVGAAAAALLLLGVRLVEGGLNRGTNDGPTTERLAVETGPAEGGDLSRVTDGEERFQSTFDGQRLKPRGSVEASTNARATTAEYVIDQATVAEWVQQSGGQPLLQQTTPANVTAEVQSSLVDSVGELRRRLDLMPEETDPELAFRRLSMLEIPIRRVRGATSMFVWLENDDYIDLPSEAIAHLSAVRQATRQLQMGLKVPQQLPYALRFARQQLAGVDLNVLRESVKVACCTTGSDFDRWVAEHHVLLNQDNAAAPFQVIQINDGRLVSSTGRLQLQQQRDQVQVQLLILPRGLSGQIQFGLPINAFPRTGR